MNLLEKNVSYTDAYAKIGSIILNSDGFVRAALIK